MIEQTKKIVFIGNGASGKTAFISRICSNYFNQRYIPTFGCPKYEITTEDLKIKGKKMTFELYDTPGQEITRDNTELYELADWIIICFTCSSKLEWKFIKTWLSTIPNIENKGIILMGTKCDTGHNFLDRSVLVKDRCDKYDYIFTFNSARTRFNTMELFDIVMG